MEFDVSYICISNVGKCRKINQDCFVCNGLYSTDAQSSLPVTGHIKSTQAAIFGVFDGMGGEDCGEIAAHIAAEEAASLNGMKNSSSALINYTRTANERICLYAKENNIVSMGTTAALVWFSERKISFCNIGDSRIYRFRNNTLEQLSVDHTAFAVYGTKPPLSQNLGIPPEELVIEPFLGEELYRHGDIYLICSDGLSDMLTDEEIAGFLNACPFGCAADKLLEAALEKGGKDNITYILCKTENKNVLWVRIRNRLLSRYE